MGQDINSLRGDTFKRNVLLLIGLRLYFSSIVSVLCRMFLKLVFKM